VNLWKASQLQQDCFLIDEKSSLLADSMDSGADKEVKIIRGSLKQEQGFTLIEVLVALAIIAIAMTAIVQTAVLAANQQIYLEEKTFANWIALNQIALKRLTPKEVDSEGEVDMASRQWSWRMKEEKVLKDFLLHVTTEVARADDAETILVSMTSVINNPEKP